MIYLRINKHIVWMNLHHQVYRITVAKCIRIQDLPRSIYFFAVVWNSMKKFQFGLKESILAMSIFYHPPSWYNIKKYHEKKNHSFCYNFFLILVVFPREHSADPIPPLSLFPLPPRVAKLCCCTQKLRNVLNRMEKPFSDFFLSDKIFILCFWGLQIFHWKI